MLSLILLPPVINSSIILSFDAFTDIITSLILLPLLLIVLLSCLLMLSLILLPPVINSSIILSFDDTSFLRKSTSLFNESINFSNSIIFTVLLLFTTSLLLNSLDVFNIVLIDLFSFNKFNSCLTCVFIILISVS